MATEHTLFNMTPRCFACGDLGLIWTDGRVSTCWRLRAGAVHNRPNEAAQMIERAVRNLMIAKRPIDQHVFHVAQSLIGFTSDRPCKRDVLIERHFTFSASSLRKFHETIETLRKEWVLPVGSRKESPGGYWIITDIDDFAKWVARAKAAPITQLTTIYRNAKRNFPVFAEQMELEFWSDMDVAEPSPLAAAA